MTSIWELPNVYFQNLLLINNTPDNNLQPQMHICPLPCTPCEQKLAESVYFEKTDSKLMQMTSIWVLPNVYFQNLLLINNTPDNNLQPQMHICPLPCTPCEQKLAESAYFEKQIPNWCKWPQFESCQMYIFKIYSSSTIHQTTAFNLKCIFVHSHAHPGSTNWLSQHIFEKQIPNWRKLPQFESCQMYIFKIYSSITIHQITTFNLKCIFVHSHAHPLSKNWLSQHIFKKQIPNWPKWPQFESCQMYIFKIYSSITIHQITTFNLKCIFVHSHAHPLSKNWLSQHIFKKQIPNWRKLPQFASCQMYIFKIYSPSTIHQTTTFNLKCIFVHSQAHPLSKNWLSQHIFKNQIPNWGKWPQFESCQMYIFKIYSSITIHQITTFNLKCIFVHFHAHPLSKNWLSQHIFKKQIPNWRKWPQFESCQMYIFKIYSSSTIHQTTTFNLKCIFVHSHAHPVSKNWLSQYILKNRFQIDANDLNLSVAKCIFSKSTPHQQYTRQPRSTSNAYLSTPMHTLGAQIGWVSIFLKNRFQIDANYLNLRVAKCIFSKSTPQ